MHNTAQTKPGDGITPQALHCNEPEAQAVTGSFETLTGIHPGLGCLTRIFGVQITLSQMRMQLNL
jgi:hypothetical protein